MIGDGHNGSLGCFAPVSLAELDGRAALQQRIDWKYIVAGSVLDELISALPADTAVLEIAGERRFGYSTTYFDSLDLMTYRAHVQGRRRRFKCRSRLYLNNNLHMLEVKLKGRRGETVKERREFPLEAHGVWDEAAHRFLHEQLCRHYRVSLDEPLAPTVQMTFSRVTLVDLVARERLTVDVDLRYELADGSSFALAPGTAIVESKSASGTAQFDRRARELGVRPVNCSKYCVGVVLTRPGTRGNDFLRIARRHFRAQRP